MNRRMKAKKMYSATLTHTWPKPVVPFIGSLGHLPVAAQPYVFVSRKAKDRATGFYKVVPEMLYPIQTNSRKPVPRHEVLEDEYRAFHNVIVNQLALRRKYNPEGARRASLLDRNSDVDFNSALWSGRIGELKDQLPELMAYNPGCPAPPGYMYQRFKKDQKDEADRVRAARRSKLVCPPTVVIKGPFQNVVRVCTPNYKNKIRFYDSAVIGRPRGTEIRIYNEPDAVSTCAVNADFEKCISERARRVCNQSKNTTTNIQ